MTVRVKTLAKTIFRQLQGAGLKPPEILKVYTHLIALLTEDLQTHFKAMDDLSEDDPE